MAQLVDNHLRVMPDRDKLVDQLTTAGLELPSSGLDT